MVDDRRRDIRRPTVSGLACAFFQAGICVFPRRLARGQAVAMWGEGPLPALRSLGADERRRPTSQGRVHVLPPPSAPTRPLLHRPPCLDASGARRSREGSFPACKPLKSLKMELESADRSVRA